MAGYKCVNFNDLCRLCSSAGTTTTNIFADECLPKKIEECLPIQLVQNDKLPKNICNQCKEYVQIFSDFRLSCSKAQKMLESCLNTSKLRNGGQVYIKDELPVKKILKPIQNPSPPKLLPNLCNIATSTPNRLVKKNILTSPNQPDFLSSIIQAVGIQNADDNSDNNITLSQSIQPQSIQPIPQYTLTLDGGTLKSGQIQYKIENAGNLISSLPAQTQIINKSIQESQNQNQSTLSQVDEFLRMKQKPATAKKENTSTSTQPSGQPKNKKPKINLILQTSPQKPKIVQQASSPVTKSFGTPTTLKSPVKSQIHIQNIEKIIPATNQTSPTKQLVLPIMVRNDRNTINTANTNDAAQIISQALQMSNNQSTISIDNKHQANPPFAFVQMKLQAPQALQLSLSPQQLQQLSFQTSNHQQQQQQQQSSITVQSIQPVQEQTDNQTQTTTQEIQKTETDDENDYGDTFNDEYYMAEDGEESYEEESQEKAISTVTESKPASSKKSKSSKILKSKIKVEDSPELQAFHQEHSDMSKKQLQQLTSINSKRAEAESIEKSINLTVCDVCKKVFKRKEFLMQHLKSHIGLRPFKCEEPQCTKSFSRKEHLLRHIVSHTGKKMFVCGVCSKLFSRKDNLKKHERIHPESGNQTVKHKCTLCNKSFSHEAQLNKHQLICDGKSNGSSEGSKVLKTKTCPAAKRTKVKVEKKELEVVNMMQPAPKSTPISQAPTQQIVTILQQQPQQQQQQQHIKLESDQQNHQIILSMPQAQQLLQNQQKGTMYTFPTNLILNSSGFMTTNGGEIVGNFKFDNQ